MGTPSAQERWVEWLQNNRTPDKGTGWLFPYHPRSGTISAALCRFIVDDILARCDLIRAQAAEGLVAYSLDREFISSVTGKKKRFDLAVGQPSSPIPSQGGISAVKSLQSVLIALEAKAAMTSHVKSHPRLFDELSSSHEIVHQGNQRAIAAGVAVVNIATRYVSPTNQAERTGPDPRVAHHAQPAVAAGVIALLRGLRVRDTVGQVGFDAFAQFVVDIENHPVHINPSPSVSLWTAPPAPQAGDPDHYDTFLDRICQAYVDRFSELPHVDV